MTYKFHNPYNFASTPKRNLENSFCGDHDPSLSEYEENHSRYWETRYNGTIPVKLRTNTPLFITDPESKTEIGAGSGHFCYDCLDSIPATSLKGMLSSAYEIITNSRFRVINKKQHDKRLGYRTTARATLVPGMIVNDEKGMRVRLFTGTSKITDEGAAGPLYAAWLPMMSRDINKVETGYYKETELELFSHGSFDFWLVKSIKEAGASFSVNSSKYTPKNKTITVSGYVFKSGKIINTKHYERFFFCDGEPKELQIKPDIRERYEDLIFDYQSAHREIGGKYINPPNNCELGDHITDNSMCELRDGDFVYVKTTNSGNAIADLYPVQISRELSKAAPWECLDDEMKPAEDALSLSPAERVFGWVPQGKPKHGASAWRGKVRISGAEYVPNANNPEPAVIRFEEPIPLSILGAPKPAQARFYLGDKDGKPQGNKISKDDAAYRQGKRLRGRKVYLHHTLKYLSKEEKQFYWDPASDYDGIREYSHFPKNMDSTRTNQNRSISSWIPQKRDFKFSISFENLTEEELGALLSLLMLEDGFYFKLGYAKPLGLGSVRLSIDWGSDGCIPVCTGADMAERYRTLGECTAAVLSEAGAKRIIRTYQKTMVKAYGDGSAEEEAEELSCLPWERKWPDDPDRYLFLSDDDFPEKKQLKSFSDAWFLALDKREKQPPLEDIAWLEEWVENAVNKLNEDYTIISAEYKKLRDSDCGWGKLQFIAEFKQSMRGTDEPVHYPRSSLEDKSEGFEWFVSNERETTQNGTKMRPGFSLPLLSENGKQGKPLEGF